MNTNQLFLQRPKMSYISDSDSYADDSLNNSRNSQIDFDQIEFMSESEPFEQDSDLEIVPACQPINQNGRFSYLTSDSYEDSFDCDSIIPSSSPPNDDDNNQVIIIKNPPVATSALKSFGIGLTKYDDAFSTTTASDTTTTAYGTTASVTDISGTSCFDDETASSAAGTSPISTYTTTTSSGTTSDYRTADSSYILGTCHNFFFDSDNE